MKENKINLIIDGLQRDDDYFDKLVSLLEDNPSYLSNEELFIILSKTHFYQDDVYYACQKRNILLSFMSDKVLCTRLLFSPNFYSDFIFVKDKGAFNILKYMDIDYLIDNIAKVDLAFDEMIYVYILDNCPLETILKFLNNDYVAKYYSNKDVRDDKILINDKKFYSIIGTKFMNRVFPASFYAYVITTEYVSYSFKGRPLEKETLEEIADIIKSYDIPKVKKILIVNEFDIPRRQKNDLLKLIFGKGMVCEREVELIKNDITNNLINLEDNGIITDLSADIREDYIGYKHTDEIIKKLFENEDKEISYDYFDVISCFLCKKFLENKDYNDISVCACSFPVGDDIAACCGNKIIFINTRQIGNKWNSLLYNGNAESHYCWLAFLLLHEIGHITQYKEFAYKNKNYITLKALKEHNLFLSQKSYYDYNRHEDIAFEIDANIKAVTDEFNFYKEMNLMDKIDFSKCKTKEEFLKIYKNDLINNRVRIVNESNSADYPSLVKSDTNILYDRTFTPKDIKPLLNMYPLLKTEYNSDGTKKSFEEILDLFNFYKKKIDSNNYTEDDKRNYNFYYLLYHDQLKVMEYRHDVKLKRKKRR